MIRGIFNFVISMKDGYSCLMKSAEKQMDDDEAEEDEKLSDKAMNAIMGVVMVLSLVIAVGLFVFLPKWIVNFADVLTVNRFVRSLAEGIIKNYNFYRLSCGYCIDEGRKAYI